MADAFELERFLPYLLAQAAEKASRGFAQVYKDRYGMLRTDWRVLFHLGNFGPMTAGQICMRADLHKTKVSRAVARLEEMRFLTRDTVAHDKRAEVLTLTRAGQAAYADLRSFAEDYETSLTQKLSTQDVETLKRVLEALRS